MLDMRYTQRLSDRPSMAQRTSRALEMKRQGYPYAAIGQALGISRQRVQQLLSPPADARAQVLARCARHCEACGIGPGVHLHLHHVSYHASPRTYHDPQNLQALCVPCHNRAHDATLTPAQRFARSSTAGIIGGQLRRDRARVKKQWRAIARLGGETRMRALTKEERQAIGRKGGLAKAANARAREQDW
jgi:DNA-binding CsgD family transcriptional regulator